MSMASKAMLEQTECLVSNASKENSRIDFPCRKYPPPRILKEFPVQRDFPIGCGNQNSANGSLCKSTLDMDDPGKSTVNINRGKSMVIKPFKVMHGIDSNSIVNKENVIIDGVVVSRVKLKENEHGNVGPKGIAKVDAVLVSQVKLGKRQHSLFGVDLLKENSRIDFPHRKYPPPRIFKGFPVRRDFPIGCGNHNLVNGDSGKSIVDMDNPGKSKSIVEMDDHGKSTVDINQGKSMDKPSKVMNKIDSNSIVNIGKSTKIMHRIRNNLWKSIVDIKPLKVMHGIDSNSMVDMNIGKSVVDMKPLMVVNSKEDMNLRKSMVHIKSLKVVPETDSNRKKVKKALHSFQEMFTKLVEDEPSVAAHLQMRAAMVLQRQFKWINTRKRLGAILGVERGDMFQWMAELNVIGLHHQFESGIDYMKVDGKILATSIIASGRYCNYALSSNFLIYSGQGGNPLVRGNQPVDQELKRGNLALKNSMEARTPVRVIRGYNISKSSSLIGVSGQKLLRKMYVYDGLYYVDHYWQERGKYGKKVFRFFLKRGQSEEWDKSKNVAFWEGHETPDGGVLSLMYEPDKGIFEF